MFGRQWLGGSVPPPGGRSPALNSLTRCPKAFKVNTKSGAGHRLTTPGRCHASATYRQQSWLTPELLERDPDNRLLARAPRFRLQAEFIRDQALAASGLLATTVGGPSVKPYHPPGLYEQITAGNGYNVYVPGKGVDLRRRSLYTYWKRSAPHPAMLLFDAPFRETCTLRRTRSNTPLQALNLMNDPTYVEAARFLAQRMMVEGGETVDARITHGFRLLLVRRPPPQELAVLRAAFERARADSPRSKAFLVLQDMGIRGNTCDQNRWRAPSKPEGGGGA
ncbi:MAG TPA: DUF1553 domain-containing protein [Pirellulales bacterium]|nr:DUF1553 domain-containing protein [Pirellulales bacterium]